MLSHTVDNNIFGDVKIQYVEQGFRRVYTEQDIYNGVNMVFDGIF